MKIERQKDGVYCATQRHADGTLCIGFDEFMSMAILYCWEMLERHNG